MRLKKLIIICMSLLLFFEIYIPIPGYCITIKEEEKLGREFMKVVKKQFRFIQDPFIQDYIDKVGKNILSVMDPQPFPYHFYIIRQDVFNAFAGPGGNVFINSGLIEAMDNENELAGILAHEITHVSSRHISQKIERSSKMGLAALAGMVAGIFLGVSGAGDAANAVSVGSMAATQSAALSYSRQDEMQADELGIQYLTKAGYTGSGMLTILKKIRETQWFGSEQIPTYIMTHPAVEDRIAYLDTWIQAHPEAVHKKKYNNEEFKKVHLRLISAYGNKENALKKIQDIIKHNSDNPIVNHAYGIALARNDNAKKGIKYVKKALQKRPFDSCMLKDLGEIYFIDGQYKNALQALKGSRGLNQNDYETLFLLGRTQMELNQFDQASLSFEKLLETKANYPIALYYLGSAYGKQGRLEDAHYYLSIYYRNKGDLKNTLFHLKQVLKHAKDSEKKQEAEKILKQVRKKAAEQKPGPIKSP